MAQFAENSHSLRSEIPNAAHFVNHAEETVEGNGSVWFGDPMRNARKSKSTKCAKRNGDPGAIRTRDPQLRRLFRKSRNSLDSIGYSENLVRSGSAMRCQEVP